MHTIRAGEELNFGQVGKSIRLKTDSNSIRCEITGERNEHKKFVATRSGYLQVESALSNMTRNGKSESKQKRDKMQIDILPYHSTRYYPQENENVVGIIVAKNPEYFSVDIGSDTLACLNTLEFQNATRKE